MATYALSPSLDDIEGLARAAWAEMPEKFRELAGDVIFRIEEVAPEEVLSELGIEDPFELSGLYQGVDLTRRSLLDPAPSAPLVFLFRLPLLDEWIARGEVTLPDLIAHVLVHEIGHHFGFSDEQMDTLLEETD